VNLVFWTCPVGNLPVIGAQQCSTPAMLDVPSTCVEDAVDGSAVVQDAKPARARPQHRLTVPSRGALKRCRPAQPAVAVGTLRQTRGLRMLRALVCIGRAAAKRRCILGGGMHRVTFQPKIRVTEFKRVLDGGGTIPGDGTHLTLGLGRALRTQTAPLAPPRLSSQPRPPPIEETAWVSPKQRERLLRRAMGDGPYFRVWSRRRREVLRIKASRRQSNSTSEDEELMPTSVEQASMRAEALAREVQWQQQDTPPALRDVRGKKRMRSASSHGRQNQHGKKKLLVRSVAAAETVSGGRQLGAAEPTDITQAATKTAAATKDAAAASICRYCQSTLPSVQGAKVADTTADSSLCPSCVLSGAIRASAAAGA